MSLPVLSQSSRGSYACHVPLSLTVHQLVFVLHGLCVLAVHTMTALRLTYRIFKLNGALASPMNEINAALK